MSGDQLFIGIDSGTQGTKGVVFSRQEGRILAEAYTDHQLIENIGGRREQEPKWWIEACSTVIGQLLRGAPLAVATCKQLVFAVAGHDEDSQKSMDEYTSKVIAGLRIMDEGQEGLAAFLEKRKPAWVEDQDA